MTVKELPAGEGRRSASLVLEPALERRVFHDVDAAGQTELSHGVGLVRLDGLDAERQARGDFLVAVAGRNQPQDLRLPLADAAVAGRLSPPRFAGERRGDRAVSAESRYWPPAAAARIAWSSSVGALCFST